MLKKTLICMISIILLSSCETTEIATALGAGIQAVKAATLTNEEMIAKANEGCQLLDNKNKVVNTNSSYSKRANKLANRLNYVELAQGVKLNYKVYEKKELNAFAMANGCVRIYSTLMDKLDDDELAGVIGHEIGHVALEHIKKGNKVGLASGAAIAAIGGVVSAKGGPAILSNDTVQSLLYGIVNAQFSQSQESQADSYSVELMKKNNINPEALATGLLKLEEASNQGFSVLGSIFSDHPSTKNRVEAIYKQVGKKNNKL